VQQHVGVAMTDQMPVVTQVDPSEPQRATLA
jgi:hypothetical protein